MATALAVVAVLAFVADRALGPEHYLPTAMGGSHQHVHSHSHGPAVAADHQLVGGEAVEGAELAAHHDGSSPLTAADSDVNCCACGTAISVPCTNAQAAPFVWVQNISFARHRYGDGIVPEGLRRPPRPLSIA